MELPLWTCSTHVSVWSQSKAESLDCSHVFAACIEEGVRPVCWCEIDVLATVVSRSRMSECQPSMVEYQIAWNFRIKIIYFLCCWRSWIMTLGRQAFNNRPPSPPSLPSNTLPLPFSPLLPPPPLLPFSLQSHPLPFISTEVVLTNKKGTFKYMYLAPQIWSGCQMQLYDCHDCRHSIVSAEEGDVALWLPSISWTSELMMSCWELMISYRV